MLLMINACPNKDYWNLYLHVLKSNIYIYIYTSLHDEYDYFYNVVIILLNTQCENSLKEMT